MFKKAKIPNLFKNNLKKLLIRHFFFRAVQLEFICILVAIFLSLAWVNFHTKKILNDSELKMNKLLESYDNYLENLVTMDNVMVSKVSITWQKVILKKLYEISLENDVNAELFIIDKNKSLFISSKSNFTEEESKLIHLQWDILDSIKENRNSLQVSISKGNDRKLFLGKAAYNKDGIYAYIILRIDGNELNNKLSKVKTVSETAANIIITNRDYWGLSVNDSTLFDGIGRLPQKLHKNGYLLFFNNGIYTHKYRELTNNNLILHVFFDYTSLAQLLFIIAVTALIVIGLLFIIELYNSERIATEFTRDISKLNEAFLEVAKGNLDKEVNISSSIEFENIGKYFNYMLHSLKKRMEENKELAEAIAYTQVRQLASQFKSHFLFNTLDNIRFICRISPELAENMIVLLAELLRYNTSNQNEKVMISEDLEYIRKYLEIIKIRFGDSFTYNIELDEKLKGYLMLKLLIQPIVENAIKYGMRNKPMLDIFISIKKVDENVCIICKDNGSGIEETLLSKIKSNLSNIENKTPHLGLYNVHRRIILTYGANYGIELENLNGVKVNITFPLEKE